MADTALAPAGAKPAFPWWLILIQGIALIVIGGLLMTKTGVTTVTLILFLGWWWLISGIFELISIFMDRTMWGWKLFSGILGILAGLYIIGAPVLGTVIVVGFATLMLGINGMVIGVMDLVKAFQGAGWGKGVLGALSLIFGFIITFNFTSFMSALPWVWGLFAVLGGIAAIISSFQLKKAFAA